MKNIFFLFMDIIFSILFRFPFCIGKEYWWLAAWDSWAGLSIQSFVAWPERNKAKGISGRRGAIWVVWRVVDGSAAAAGRWRRRLVAWRRRRRAGRGEWRSTTASCAHGVGTRSHGTSHMPRICFFGCPASVFPSNRYLTVDT